MCAKGGTHTASIAVLLVHRWSLFIAQGARWLSSVDRFIQLWPAIRVALCICLVLPRCLPQAQHLLHATSQLGMLSDLFYRIPCCCCAAWALCTGKHQVAALLQCPSCLECSALGVLAHQPVCQMLAGSSNCCAYEGLVCCSRAIVCMQHCSISCMCGHGQCQLHHHSSGGLVIQQPCRLNWVCWRASLSLNGVMPCTRAADRQGLACFVLAVCICLCLVYRAAGTQHQQRPLTCCSWCQLVTL